MNGPPPPAPDPTTTHFNVMNECLTKLCKLPERCPSIRLQIAMAALSGRREVPGSRNSVEIAQWAVSIADAILNIQPD